MNKIKHILTIISLALIVSCTARYTSQVYNVSNAPVVTHGKQVTQEKVGQIITASGKGLGWNMQTVRPGLIIGTLHLRTHVARVNIYYTATSYSIKYAGSKNLSRGSLIHKNYNGWIQNLDNAIQTNLSIVN